MAPFTLNQHEKVLVNLYRAAPIDVRKRIDGDLFDCWTHHPCSLDSRAPETARFRLAVTRLHAAHVSGKPLAGFATFWTMKGGA
jgi:hypothetical protein